MLRCLAHGTDALQWRPRTQRKRRVVRQGGHLWLRAPLALVRNAVPLSRQKIDQRPPQDRRIPAVILLEPPAVAGKGVTAESVMRSEHHGGFVVAAMGQRWNLLSGT